METKQYTIIRESYCPHRGDWEESQHSGSLEELKEMFSYTLECGRAYMYEEGALPVKRIEKIEDIYELEEALNNASHNASHNRCDSEEPDNFCLV